MSDAQHKSPFLALSAGAARGKFTVAGVTARVKLAGARAKRRYRICPDDDRAASFQYYESGAAHLCSSYFAPG